MSRNNTGNPIGSKAFPDFEDNVKNLDQAVNAEQDTFQDRLGKSRLTWAGMESGFGAGQVSREQRFNTFIASSGYQFAGDYAQGIEITEYNQLVRDENGEFWRVSGQVDLPYVTTGDGIPEGGALVPAGDAVLRQELSRLLPKDVLDSIVRPEFFGAIGNGDHDDTGAFIAMAASTGGRRAIFLRDDAEYRLTSTVEIPTVKFSGVYGSGSSIVIDANVPALRATGTAIESGAANATNIPKSKNEGAFTIEGVRFFSSDLTHSFGAGVQLVRTFQAVIRNCLFSGLGRGVWFEGVNRNTSISGNQFFNIRHDAIYFAVGHNIHQITISNNSGFGFEIFLNADNCDLTNMIFIGNWLETYSSPGGQQMPPLHHIRWIPSNSSVESLIHSNRFQCHSAIETPMIHIATQTPAKYIRWVSIKNNEFSNIVNSSGAIKLFNTFNTEVDGNHLINGGSGPFVDMEISNQVSPGSIGTRSSYLTLLNNKLHASSRILKASINGNFGALNVSGNTIVSSVEDDHPYVHITSSNDTSSFFDYITIENNDFVKRLAGDAVFIDMKNITINHISLTSNRLSSITGYRVFNVSVDGTTRIAVVSLNQGRYHLGSSDSILNLGSGREQDRLIANNVGFNV